MKRLIVVSAVGLVAAMVAFWVTLLPRTSDDTSQRTSVVVYLIDTLRADRLRVYGYENSLSPTIDRLAMEGVVFENAYAPAPWTVPSVTSLLTSTFVCEHGITTERKRLHPGLETLTERLYSAGYFTGGGYANFFVGPWVGLERGYQMYNPLPQETADYVVDLLRNAEQRPFFFYFHTMEPHEFGAVPANFLPQSVEISPEKQKRFHQLLNNYHDMRRVDWAAGKRVGNTDNTSEQQQALESLAQFRYDANALYDASISWADENLGEVIDSLKTAGAWDNTLFILLSDHGEELGDRGLWVHGHSLYEEMLHVPLIIKFPLGQYANRRVNDIVSLVDVMPTILEIVGHGELCGECRGKSLLPALSGASVETTSSSSIQAMRVDESEFYAPLAQSRGTRNLLIRRGFWKAIWNMNHGDTELYDMRSDRAEQINISSRHSEVVNDITAEAQEWLDGCYSNAKQPDAITNLPPELVEKMRAVGYIQ